MKEQMNELMQEFLKDCKDGSANREGFRYTWTPSFDNFIKWLDGRTWDMEKETWQ